MLAARTFRRAVAPVTAFMAHVSATVAAFVVGFCVVLMVLGTAWTIIDGLSLLILSFWS